MNVIQYLSQTAQDGYYNQQKLKAVMEEVSGVLCDHGGFPDHRTGVEVREKSLLL